MNIHRNTRVTALGLTLLTSLGFSVGARADDTHHKPSAAAAAEAGGMTDGEVRKIDLEAGKVTLRHAEIKSLDMPPMTMVFVVKDKTLIDKLKAGDKVKFKAVNDAGKYTVIDIRLAR